MPERQGSARQALDAINPIFVQTTLLALFFAAIVLITLGLRETQVILAPLMLGVIFGMMLGPLADGLESRGIVPAVSAAVVVLALLLCVFAAFYVFAQPISEWLRLLPLIWKKLQGVLADLRQPLQSLGSLREQFQDAVGGGSAMKVEIEQGHPVQDAALLAPAIIAQVVLFLVSAYFFLATRRLTRNSILSVMPGRSLRWRMAHMFKDVEARISRFMLAVSVINLIFGVVIAVVMWALGMPAPILWGVLAATLNFIPYVGQVFMVALVTIVSMATQTGWIATALPPVLYSIINFIESQFITPHFLGRTLTLNPFLIFVSLTFWIWVWGPVGGLVAIPFMLIMQSVATHALAPASRLRSISALEKRQILERAAYRTRIAAANGEH